MTIILPQSYCKSGWIVIIIYRVLYGDKNWDVCIKIDTETNYQGFYFRRYSQEFDSVCEFREL